MERKTERKPGGKTRVKEIWELKEEDVLDRTKWKGDIPNHSGDPRLWEKRENRVVRCKSMCTHQ